MFDLFKYFIYLVRGSLDYFDPATDRLVGEDAYLTWRRLNDEAPRGVPYAGAIRDNQLNKWVVLRFNRRAFFEEVEDWLESQAKGKESLGAYEASKFQGLLREDPPYAEISLESWYNHKLPLVKQFFTEHWEEWPTWLARELEAYNFPHNRWDHLRGILIQNLLAEGGVR